MSTFNFFTQKKKNYLYSIFIVFFAFFINWHYSKYGIFPIDTFLHYDSAYRILNGEYPIKDYWIVSGFLVDFIQAFFFKIFNVSWYSYIIHSSLFNSIISISTFYILIKLNLKKKYAFFYSISFCLLAYPVSGTPFVDLHAAFFCVIATYFTFLAVIKPDLYLNWVLIVFFYLCAFLSKQVPAAYLIILNFLIIFPYLLINKKFKVITVIFFSLLASLLLVILILNLLNIDLNLFYIQYFDYPRSIGMARFKIYNLSIENLINEFKFILTPILFLCYLKLKKIYNNEISFFSIEFINFLVFLSLCLSLLVHQILTKNQAFIFFLIPLSIAHIHIEIEKLNLRFKNLFVYLIIIFIVFSTTKYHLRFNEGRKFHELHNTDFSKSEKSITIDKSLKGISWINPYYKGEAKQEIEKLKRIKYKIQETKSEIMLITHYLFLDSITFKNLNSPSRTHTLDGASIPTSDNKYFDYYQNFLKQKLIKKKIKEIYIIKDENISEDPFKVITQFFEKNCYTRTDDSDFTIIKLKKECLY